MSFFALERLLVAVVEVVELLRAVVAIRQVQLVYPLAIESKNAVD